VGADRRADLSFQPLDQVRWQQVEIDIGGIESLDALDQALSETFSRCAEKGDGRPVILRIRLSGRGELYSSLRQPSITGELLERSRELGAQESPSVWVQDMAVDCRPEADLDQRAEMDDLLGQILKNTLDLGTAPDALPERLAPILSDLYQHTRLSKHLEAPSPPELLSLLQDAALICFDHLEPDP
jgi:hypothetical protein